MFIQLAVYFFPLFECLIFFLSHFRSENKWHCSQKFWLTPPPLVHSQLSTQAECLFPSLCFPPGSKLQEVTKMLLLFIAVTQCPTSHLPLDWYLDIEWNESSFCLDSSIAVTILNFLFGLPLFILKASTSSHLFSSTAFWASSYMFSFCEFSRTSAFQL